MASTGPQEDPPLNVDMTSMTRYTTTAAIRFASTIRSTTTSTTTRRLIWHSIVHLRSRFSWSRCSSCNSRESGQSEIQSGYNTKRFQFTWKVVKNNCSWGDTVSPMERSESMIVLIRVKNSATDLSPFFVLRSSDCNWRTCASVFAWEWWWTFSQSCQVYRTNDFGQNRRWEQWLEPHKKQMV